MVMSPWLGLRGCSLLKQPKPKPHGPVAGREAFGGTTVQHGHSTSPPGAWLKCLLSAGLDPKFLAKWHCSVFRCYLANIVQSWSN
jgi:hypothetical protein